MMIYAYVVYHNYKHMQLYYYYKKKRRKVQRRAQEQIIIINIIYNNKLEQIQTIFYA